MVIIGPYLNVVSRDARNNKRGVGGRERGGIWGGRVPTYILWEDFL